MIIAMYILTAILCYLASGIVHELGYIVMGIIFLQVGIITRNIVFLLLGAMPLAMEIICILPLPLKTGILYTDGGRWNRLHRGGQEADEERALFKLTENQI